MKYIVYYCDITDLDNAVMKYYGPFDSKEDAEDFVRHATFKQYEELNECSSYIILPLEEP